MVIYGYSWLLMDDDDDDDDDDGDDDDGGCGGGKEHTTPPRLLSSPNKQHSTVKNPIQLRIRGRCVSQLLQQWLPSGELTVCNGKSPCY